MGRDRRAASLIVHADGTVAGLHRGRRGKRISRPRRSARGRPDPVLGVVARRLRCVRSSYEL